MMKLTKKGKAILLSLLHDMGEPIELMCTYTIRKGSIRGYDEQDDYKPIYYEHSCTYIRYYVKRLHETWEYIEEHDTGNVLHWFKLQDGKF